MIKSGIMGLVIGDSLGVPYEFKKRDNFKATDMVGYGTFSLPEGTWSDDSSLTLATLDSLITNKGKINLHSIMKNFADWFYNDKYTPHDKCFDTGNTTRNSIMKFDSGIDLMECGGYEEMDNGNGSLMRILPLAFIKHTDEDIFNVSALTHGNIISKVSCLLYIKIAEKLIKNYNISDAIKDSYNELGEYKIKELDRIPTLEELERDEIKSSGYVIDTLEAALWCLLKTNTFRDCALMAVNLGGDTDTVAAVACGLAGLLYGYNSIPKEWIDKIAKKQYILSLCNDFKAITHDLEMKFI